LSAFFFFFFIIGEPEVAWAALEPGVQSSEFIRSKQQQSD